MCADTKRCWEEILSRSKEPSLAALAEALKEWREYAPEKMSSPGVLTTLAETEYAVV